MTSHVKYECNAFMELLSRTFKRIEGKAKTVIDSALADPTQREAAKSLFEQLLWKEYDTFRSILAGIEKES